MCVLSKIENLKCVKEKVMEFRKVFDTIPEQFDKYRPDIVRSCLRSWFPMPISNQAKKYWNLVQEQVRLQNQF